MNTIYRILVNKKPRALGKLTLTFNLSS